MHLITPITIIMNGISGHVIIPCQHRYDSIVYVKISAMSMVEESKRLQDLLHVSVTEGVTLQLEMSESKDVPFFPGKITGPLISIHGTPRSNLPEGNLRVFIILALIRKKITEGTRQMISMYVWWE